MKRKVVGLVTVAERKVELKKQVAPGIPKPPDVRKYENPIITRTVDTHIRRLRAKLGGRA
jgi:hypothetical protein